MTTKQEIINIVDAAYYLTASGTNTYTASATPALLSYTAGKHYFVQFTNANTGACTLNINGLGAKNIFKVVSSPLALGDIPANNIVEMIYDGTNFQTLGGVDLLTVVSQKINSAASNFVQTII